MDVLSELLADVRIRGAVFVRTQVAGQGQLRVAHGERPCFHLVTQGRLWLHPPGGAAPVPLGPGDVAFLPQGQAHSLASQPSLPEGLASLDLAPRWREAQDAEESGPAQACRVGAGTPVAATISGCMHIEGVTPAWLWGGLPPWLTLQWGREGMPQWLAIGLAYLEQELGRRALASQAVIDRLGDVLFIQSLRSYLRADDAAAPPGWLLGLKDAMVSRVLGAMHREPARPWQLAELASVGCVSRSVLAERFTQLLGVPPLAYLTRHRMQLAARRLREGRLAVAEVAASVGYHSSPAFAQAFRREFGCSPRQWRAQGQVDEAQPG